MAYVVGSANEHIATLSASVKRLEKQLADAQDDSQAVKRNYETLSRIRQQDQIEFDELQQRLDAQANELQEARLLVDTERCRVAELEGLARSGNEARERLAELEKTTADSSAADADLTSRVDELSVSNGKLKMHVEKLTRVQHETLLRARAADATIQRLNEEKEAAEAARVALAGKAEKQEKQLRTLFEANEAMEADLREQVARVDQLERLKLELEAERTTLEAYWEARLAEAQVLRN